MSKKTEKARSDDYPELTQKDFDRAIKRKGLKKQPLPETKPEEKYIISIEDFDDQFEWLAKCLAKKALEESKAGKTIPVEELKRKNKIPVNK